NYLHYNLYDQAEKLRSKAPQFEAHSNQQLGKIRTIQLEYTDAKESLIMQAARKAPVAAQGFRIQCNKWAIIVCLLLGEIPERTICVQKGMKICLSLTPNMILCFQGLLTLIGGDYGVGKSTLLLQTLFVAAIRGVQNN
ncbi:putative 26S proteasome non-ATPase regulatory subunit 3-like protein, partial [Trifolium pratense]